MRILKRSQAVAALAAGLVVAGSGAAWADNIQDDIVDVGAGVSLVAGDSTSSGTAKIRVVANNSDGSTTDPGCNWDTGESALVLNIITPTGVTATPDPLSITACGTDQTVTFTADATAVSGTVTVSIVSSPAGGGGYNNQVSIPITVTRPAPVNTAPTLTLPGNLTAEATGPNGAAVSYTATASDAEDGALAADCSPASGSTFPLGTTTVNCSATDSAGASDTGSFTVTVVDTTPPSITWIGGPEDGGSYYFGSVPAASTCTASDLVSGNVNCTVTGYSTAVGTPTLTASATDGAGNTATDSRSYTVLAWTLGGFYSPVDMGGVWNSVKGGSTVPLKFEAFAASELTSTSAVASFMQKQVTCPSGTAAIDEIEIVSTGGTSLRYDATGGQFIQTWVTPKKPGTCHVVTMTTQDGSKISANFTLK